MSLQALYDKALADTLKAGENWEDWFDPAVPADEVECLEDFTLSSDSEFTGVTFKIMSHLPSLGMLHRD